MLKISIIAVISVFLSVILKQKSVEFSTIVSVCGGVVILIICFENITNLINYYFDLSLKVGIDNDIFKIALKILAVGYLTEFTSNFANDLGNSAIASKVVLGGKIVICIITLPVLKELVLLLFSFY